MRIIFQWKEGRNLRQTETDLPDIEWGTDYIEHIRKALYTAFKYSDEDVPKNLLKEGETL